MIYNFLPKVNNEVLGIPVKTENPLYRTNTPPAESPFGFKLHGQFVPA